MVFLIASFTELLVRSAAADQFQRALEVRDIRFIRLLLHDLELTDEVSKTILAENRGAFRGYLGGWQDVRTLVAS